MMPLVDEARELVRKIADRLHDAGYWEAGDERDSGYVAVARAFGRMADDAQAHRKRPGTSGRDVALSFLKATVEDVNKPMVERMEAARTLLMHSEEGR